MNRLLKSSKRLVAASDQKRAHMAVLIKIQTAVRAAVVIKDTHLDAELLGIVGSDPDGIYVLFGPSAQFFFLRGAVYEYKTGTGCSRFIDNLRDVFIVHCCNNQEGTSFRETSVNLLLLLVAIARKVL